MLIALASADPGVKVCSRCGETKPATAEFYHPRKWNKGGLAPRCRACLLHVWRERDKSPKRKEQSRAARRLWRATDAGRAIKLKGDTRYRLSEKGQAKERAKRSKWTAEKLADENRRARERYEKETTDKREVRRARIAGLMRRYRSSDPQFKLRMAISSAMAGDLKRRGQRKPRSWEKLVGYTAADLKVHLERQFVRGMSWDNYGAWHVDHILPVSSFRWRSAEDPDFRACWALSNLRPLWSQHNLAKSNKRLHLL